MAYGAIAGPPLVVGLYTALVPLVVYIVMGTSRPLSVTSTSTIAILTAGALGQVAPGGDSASLMAASATLALLTGGFLLLGGLLRLGVVANLISDPVLTGFKAGIGIIIVLDQLPKLLGIHIAKAGFFRDIVSIGGTCRRPPCRPCCSPWRCWPSCWASNTSPRRSRRRWSPWHSASPFRAFAGLDKMGIALVGTVQAGLPPIRPSRSLPGEATLAGGYGYRTDELRRNGSRREGLRQAGRHGPRCKP